LTKNVHTEIVCWKNQGSVWPFWISSNIKFIVNNVKGTEDIYFNVQKL